MLGSSQSNQEEEREALERERGRCLVKPHACRRGVGSELTAVLFVSEHGWIDSTVIYQLLLPWREKQTQASLLKNRLFCTDGRTSGQRKNHTILVFSWWCTSEGISWSQTIAQQQDSGSRTLQSLTVKPPGQGKTTANLQGGWETAAAVILPDKTGCCPSPG